MDPGARKTFEEKVLEARPNVRREVMESDQFQAWKDQLPTVEVEGTRLYVRGGDLLQDETQLAYDWAYQTGLLTDADVADAATEHADSLASSPDLELTDLSEGDREDQ